jgi:hypothetical protein
VAVRRSTKYIGRPWRALLFVSVVTFWVFAFAHGLWGLTAQPVASIGLHSAVFAFAVFTLFDAALLAVRAKVYVRRWYNRWYVYAFVTIALYLFWNANKLLGAFGAH